MQVPQFSASGWRGLGRKRLSAAEAGQVLGGKQSMVQRSDLPCFHLRHLPVLSSCPCFSSSAPYTLLRQDLQLHLPSCASTRLLTVAIALCHFSSPFSGQRPGLVASLAASLARPTFKILRSTGIAAATRPNRPRNGERPWQIMYVSPLGIVYGLFLATSRRSADARCPCLLQGHGSR